MFISPRTAALVLAPMDGVTDAFMRGILSHECPFSYCVTEFVRVSGIVPPAHVFTRHIPELTRGCVTEAGTAVQVQILGGEPDKMAQSALAAVRLGARGIDINFGCPAPTVNRHDGGATLLKFPDRIEAIVRAVRDAVPAELPVSAKLRLGWDDPRAILVNAERAERGGASWITIHGRTKMQGYTPPAYWRPIGEARRALSIPVVANGEIWNIDDLKRCQDESGCIHFMLGRGALARPDMVATCARHLGLATSTRKPSYTEPPADQWFERINNLVKHSRTCGEADRKTLSRVKQWLNYAHKHGGLSWFDMVKRAADTRELGVAMQRIFAHLEVPRTEAA